MLFPILARSYPEHLCLKDNEKVTQSLLVPATESPPHLPSLFYSWKLPPNLFILQPRKLSEESPVSHVTEAMQPGRVTAGRGLGRDSLGLFPGNSGCLRSPQGWQEDRGQDGAWRALCWGRKWQPTPVFLPGESQGWGSLVGCCLWGRTESNTTKAERRGLG